MNKLVEDSKKKKKCKIKREKSDQLQISVLSTRCYVVHYVIMLLYIMLLGVCYLKFEMSDQS